MLSDRRRLACLIAGLLALGAALLGVLAQNTAFGLLAGGAGFVGGLLGAWPRSGVRNPAEVSAPSTSPTTAPGPLSPAAPVAPAAPARAATIAALATVDDEALLVDAESGLFTESYLLVALEARIAAARRRLRPVSVVILDVVEGLYLGDPTPGDPTIVASAVRTTLREADTAGRLANDHYLLVLEDTNETGAVWTVERVRNKLSIGRPGCTIWAGIACYPAHGFTVSEILAGAEHALVLARQWRQDRIEVAVTK